MARTNSCRRICRLLVFIGSGLFALQSPLAEAATIVNGTRTVILSLQTRSAHSPWQGNVLRGPLGVQRPTTIYVPPDACICDLKATFEDGHRITRQRVDLCRASTYVLRDF